MAKDDQSILKHPVSQKKFQCISPCFYPNTLTLHPVELIYVSENKPFCAVNEYVEKDEATGTKIIRYTDLCYNPTHKKDTPNVELNSLYPYINFNPEYFLKTEYKIYSFDDFVNWYVTNKTAILTVERVLNCLWEVCGKDVDVLNEKIADIYLELIKKVWIYDIYEKLHLFISKDKVVVDPDNNKLNISNHSDKRMKFITDAITKNEMYKLLTKHLKNKDKDKDKCNHNSTIKTNIIDFLINKFRGSLVTQGK